MLLYLFVEVLRADLPATWYHKVVDRPYQRVPVPGELVSLSDDEDDLGFQWPVQSVTWHNDGTADLWLEPVDQAGLPDAWDPTGDGFAAD